MTVIKLNSKAQDDKKTYLQNITQLQKSIADSGSVFMATSPIILN